MRYSWTLKWNKFKYGLIAGFISPVIGFLIAFLVIGNNMSFLQFSSYFFGEINTNNLVSEIYLEMRQNTLMFCLLVNMLIFYFSFFIFKIDQFSKGIVGLTLIWAAISTLFIN